MTPNESPKGGNVGDIYDVATTRPASGESAAPAHDPSEETDTPTVGDIYDVESVHNKGQKTTEEDGQEGSALKIIR
jgi:hypothetical protein